MQKNLEERLKRLEPLTLVELREEFRKATGTPFPQISSTETLKSFIAWDLQAKTLGGLSLKKRRRLRELQENFSVDSTYTPSPTFKFKPGTILTRIWNGTRHDVLVEESGFKYQEEKFSNLSEIATHITGSRWSGPAFFGLKVNSVKRNGNGQAHP